MGTAGIIVILLLVAGAGFAFYSCAKTVDDEERPHHDAVRRATALLADRDMLYRNVWGDTNVSNIIDQELKGLSPESKKIIEALDKTLRSACRLDEPTPEDPESYSPRRVKVSDEQRAYFNAQKQGGATLEYPTVEVAVAQAKLKELARATALYGDRKLKDAYIDFLRSTLSALREQLPKHALAGHEPSTLTLSAPFNIDGDRLRAGYALPLFHLDDAIRKHDGSLLSKIFGDPGLSRPLKDTPLRVLLMLQFPLSIPLKSRFEHHWLIGGSGHGKTQALQHFIAHDLPHILEGKRSIIVIDSQSQMIPSIAALKIWEDHPDRLVHIDPARNPLPLNLFENVKGEREFNVLLEAYRFIVDSILDSSDFTGKQGLVFESLMLLMTKIKGATIATLIELLSDTGIQTYQEEIESLDPIPRDFLKTKYIGGGRTDQYRTTREEVSRRLYQFLIDGTFGKMFSQRGMAVDFNEAMQAGRCILIDTNQDHFQLTKSRLIGSLFIGLIYQAFTSRSLNSTPCFFYVDECWEYFAKTGPLLRGMLSQARKRNVGVLLAHQDLTQLNEAPGLFGALAASTSIKMVGGPSLPDAKTLAPMLEWKPEDLRALNRGQFATQIDYVTSGRAVFQSELHLIEKMETREMDLQPSPKRPEPKQNPDAEPKEDAQDDPTKAAPW